MNKLKPAVKRAIKRYKNAHKVDCKNCNRDEKAV